MKNATELTVQRINSNYLLGTLCDQAPSRTKKLYFTKFFNIPTATHTKFAHVVLSNQFPTCYIKINKVKRGYYTLQFVPIDITAFLPYNEDNAHRFVDFYNELLEKHIRENPAQWLWTHNRWKHTPNENDKLSPLLT
jgi:KDO2-lipid IV(A) lauroyltransferase